MRGSTGAIQVSIRVGILTRWNSQLWNLSTLSTVVGPVRAGVCRRSPAAGHPCGPGGAISSSKRCPAALLVPHTAPDVSRRLVDRLAEQMNLRAISLGGHQLWERDVDPARAFPTRSQARPQPTQPPLVAFAGRHYTANPILVVFPPFFCEAPRCWTRPNALEALALEPYVFADASESTRDAR